jgi:uncharacterized circularly permuted ATP-grasp superfamily protein/uncharacterized alpha-E superfamily protein
LIPETAPRVPPLLNRYSPLADHFDEMLGPDGVPRPHWSSLVDFLDRLDPGAMGRRWDEGRRLIVQNGVTYNVYGDPQSVDRLWPLDPIPLIIDAQEWGRIEAAVIQRATLLNTVLADLYGPQRLLHGRQLPPELVLAHPSFLRPCHGIDPPHGIYLHKYAADIARSPDGAWWVLADRTQAPSGAAYALENRMVATRTLPDLLGSSGVRPLADYVHALMSTLLAISPAHKDNPRIVLLTPGPYNETYFEHAYMARQLGISLVEGGDLLVRDRRVYLKTLGGLLPVDVIFRRQDDSFCDPLELRPDSLLGIPGLVQAVRDGHVAVANMLGSGLAEAPGLLAFLPGLCRHLLGEDLRIPSVATWWCGQPGPLRYVEENPSGLVIKPALHAQRPPAFVDKLSDSERAGLFARISKRPHEWIAQERVALSTAPVLSEDGQGVLPRHIVLRVHAVASNGTYSVMPGGLTRFSASKDSLVVSVQSGGGSKDTWVLGAGPSPSAPVIPRHAHVVDVNRATFDLPSRIADNLFWLGRYAERIDAAARLARAALIRIARHSRPTPDLDAVCDVLGGLGFVSRPHDQIVDLASLAAEMDSVIIDPERRGSLAWTVNKMHRIGWLLRDRVSTDTWMVLSRLAQRFQEPLPVPPFRQSACMDLLDRTILRLSAFSGYVMESMTRGQGWRFLDIGRRIERALQTIDLVRYGLPSEADEHESERLEAILEVADCLITYRSRYLSSMQADLVVDLLIQDEANPRSVAYQFARLESQLERLPSTAPDGRLTPERRIIEGALSELRVVELDQLMRPDQRGRRIRLHVLLRTTNRRLHELSSALTRDYLTHTRTSSL